MRLFSPHKVGQSSQELFAAALFSFVIHGLFLATALFISMIRMSIAPIPVSYQVALVNAPADAPPAVSAAPQPAPATVARKQAPAPKAPPALPSKHAMPELGDSKKILKKTEQPRPTEAPATSTKSTPPSAVPTASVGPGAKTEGVVVSAPQDPRLGDYGDRVRYKIKPNWNPPAGARGAKARVLFQILRSGMVRDVKLLESSGDFYFDQAAIRAIRSSSSFPSLPYEFPREFLEMSVDLTPEE